MWRKLPYLGELAKNENSNGVIGGPWYNIFDELYPEFNNWFKNINFKKRFQEYKELWLVETEKFLRRLKVVSLRMDRFSSFLIKKIRNSMYSSNSPTHSGKVKDENMGTKPVDQESEKNNREEFKRREQKLILEIAKNPKNGLFYEELGNLYVEMGEYEDAKNSYEAAVELNPNKEELKKQLSQVLEKIGSSV